MKSSALELLKEFERGLSSRSPMRSRSNGNRHQAARFPPINLLVTDESRMGCQLLKNALEAARSNFTVTACAVTRSEILQCIEAQAVDIALISQNLYGEPLMGFSVLEQLRLVSPKTRNILLLHSSSTDSVLDAFRGGARGVFCCEESLETLCKCIRAVREGQIWANSSQLLSVLELLVNTKPLRVVNSKGARLLTQREEDVVNLVAEGLTNREVARDLGVTEHTVSNYLFRIYEKLGISSRVELTLYALNQKKERKA